MHVGRTTAHRHADAFIDMKTAAERIMQHTLGIITTQLVSQSVGDHRFLAKMDVRRVSALPEMDRRSLTACLGPSPKFTAKPDF